MKNGSLNFAGCAENIFLMGSRSKKGADFHCAMLGMEGLLRFTQAGRVRRK
jgi:hypothetical protein